MLEGTLWGPIFTGQRLRWDTGCSSPGLRGPFYCKEQYLPLTMRARPSPGGVASKGPLLTLQALGCRPSELGCIAGHLARPKQGAQQPVTGLVQRPRGLLALQQAHCWSHVWQGHLSWVAGSCGKGRIWAGGGGMGQQGRGQRRGWG